METTSAPSATSSGATATTTEPAQQDHQQESPDPSTAPAQANDSPAATSPSSETATPSNLPTAFPKRRRGRPPGRPNTRGNEPEFLDNPAVQKWNSAKTNDPMIVVPINIREALTESLLQHENQKQIFQQESCEIIYYVQGWITGKHIAGKRPSYVNGLLIHSRGRDAVNECSGCTERREKNALGPFLTCRTLPGQFHDCCSNCKWFDSASTCSLFTGPKPNRKRKSKALTSENGDISGAGTGGGENGSVPGVGVDQTGTISTTPVASMVGFAEQQQQQQQQHQDQQQYQHQQLGGTLGNHHTRDEDIHPDLLAGADLHGMAVHSHDVMMHGVDQEGGDDGGIVGDGDPDSVDAQLITQLQDA
ncbi:hypothetical protein QBC35DRAFT_286244 [Podospora australis]|uniref:Uncharacterized protein n=1 Tax=Podospora australis TaxID=1536484 RepID=A0AAN6WQD8_9PEZI|nr:hypothetical protein QBC35DRAFT_286244 [Podospora australis]